MRSFRAVISVVFAVVIASLALAAPAGAVDYGTREEAIAMAKRVQQKFRSEGVENAFKAINAKTAEFHDRDLFAFIIDLDGFSRANGAAPSLIGKNIIDLKDQDGKFPVREIVNLCKASTPGWVDYRYASPVTKQVDDKSTYVERVANQPLCIGVGIYMGEQVNDNTVTVISGNPNSDETYLQVAYDLSEVLNNKASLRVLPIVGIGGAQNIRDVLKLKGVDIGITQTNILNAFRRSADQALTKSDINLVYVTNLFTEEVHVITRSDIVSIDQLKGRKVNFDHNGSGTAYSMRDVFLRLGINVQEVNMSQAAALEKLKTREIDATILIAGKPDRSMTKIRASDGLRLLPLPFATSMVPDYLPTAVSHDDYPDLVPAGQSVETLAVTAVLIAFNWPKNSERYRRVQKFVEAFFPKIDEFQKPPHHVKWREVNLAATLPGWNRFEPATTWLASSRTAADAAPAADARLAPPAKTDDVLFQEFLRWKRAQQN